MKPQTLINFRVSPDTKAKYQEASDVIGVSISEICRKALDNAVLLAETLKTQKPTVSVGKGEPPGHLKGFLHAPKEFAKEVKEITIIDDFKLEKTTPEGESTVRKINTKGVFVRKGEEWVEKEASSP
jgi:hypothetical protein